jgi:hypothetical protein
MWLSSRLRIAATLLALGLAPVLSACSGLTPVYGPQGVAAQQMALAYAKPAGRLEQIIYEDLALKLGRADGAAPTLSVSAQSISRNLTSDTLAPNVPTSQKQVMVSAAIKLTDVNGKLLFSGMRSATADYTTNSQGLASDRAAADASIRAAHALADIIRLTILGTLAK